MPGLTIGWEYLTGYAVATDPSSRDRAEWPPHPARVFMALAAAWFETGEDQDEGKALRWLEALGEPEMVLPRFEDVHERTKVTVYVPVNDKAGPSSAILQSASSITRSKQPRTFPRVHLGDGCCFMSWAGDGEVDAHCEALSQLCSKVTRIGHSSSLVQMWVEKEDMATLGEAEHCDHLVVDEGIPETHVRNISAGMLDMLTERFGEEPRRRHTEITSQIDKRKASKKAAKGKGSKDRKAEISQEIHALEEEQSGIVVRPRVRPTIGLWSGYRRNNSMEHEEVSGLHTRFDPEIVVLRHVGGLRLPVASTLAVTRALRNTVMSTSGVQPVPAWVSGHGSDGQPHNGVEGHMACFPLPFVGAPHADGHLMGVGIVFPRSVDRRERGEVLGKLLVNSQGEPNIVELRLGSLGVWRVEKCDWTESRQALKPESWTAYTDRERGATTWASVTPIVLDKFPKSSRTKDRSAWTREVEEIIKGSCERIGLPAPKYIDIDTTCWHRGSPRAIGKRRSLRGHSVMNTDAALGDGFPLFPSRGTNAPRPQVHVWLKFDQRVVGPVLLGTGRYLGYGLCKPVVEGSQ